MINLAVAGIGDWGRNHARNFSQLPDANLVFLCDVDEARLRAAQALCPTARITQDFREVTSSAEVQAVVIAAPAGLHYSLAKEALLAGKHTFVEKPLSLKLAEAEELARLAQETGNKLMVGDHLLLHHPATAELKSLVDSGELGEVYYIYSQRVNLGKIHRDETALWCFAPHDLAIIMHLLGEAPESISARGEAYLREGVEDVVFLNLRFKNKRMAQLQLSWLDPHKLRKITVVGSRKMAVFDDMENTEKLRVYDKGVDTVEYESYGDSLTLRFGDIHIPRINMTEPLRAECQRFLDYIHRDRQPLSTVRDSLRLVGILEAAQESLAQDGVPVRCRPEET